MTVKSPATSPALESQEPLETTADANPIQFIAEEKDAHQRIDHFLAQNLSFLSRTRIQQLIQQGCVFERVHAEQNKEPQAYPVQKCQHKVRAFSEYTVIFPPTQPSVLTPLQMDLKVIYEDEFILVLDKPAGLVVHPGPGHSSETLVHGLLYHCQEQLSGIAGVEKPGLVHRLDKETSGVMVIAKEDQAHQNLTQQFAQREVQKTYWGFVWGTPLPLSGLVDGPIGRDPKNRQKMAIVSKGRPAQTSYRVLAVSLEHKISFIEFHPLTGRTHQIRVHALSLKTPLVADKVYGRNRISSFDLPERHALHARSLQFKHPISQKPLFFESPLPQDLATILSLFPEIR
jgi:23S rRNA pseudouridine1911/1915/1917 synthase